MAIDLFGPNGLYLFNIANVLNDLGLMIFNQLKSVLIYKIGYIEFMLTFAFYYMHGTIIVIQMPVKPARNCAKDSPNCSGTRMAHRYLCDY